MAFDLLLNLSNVNQGNRLPVLLCERGETWRIPFAKASAMSNRYSVEQSQ
jgi:hypothetical protein